MKYLLLVVFSLQVFALDDIWQHKPKFPNAIRPNSLNDLFFCYDEVRKMDVYVSGFKGEQRYFRHFYSPYAGNYSFKSYTVLKNTLTTSGTNRNVFLRYLDKTYVVNLPAGKKIEDSTFGRKNTYEGFQVLQIPERKIPAHLTIYKNFFDGSDHVSDGFWSSKYSESPLPPMVQPYLLEDDNISAINVLKDQLSARVESNLDFVQWGILALTEFDSKDSDELIKKISEKYYGRYNEMFRSDYYHELEHFIADLGEPKEFLNKLQICGFTKLATELSKPEFLKAWQSNYERAVKVHNLEKEIFKTRKGKG